MTHCAKCGAELIGSRKFCAACGTPAGDPRSPAASTGQAPIASGHVIAPPGSAPGSGPGSSPSSGPSIQYAPPPPVSQVNPFAQTAGPATSARAAVAASDYGPPPASVPAALATTTRGVGDPSVGPQVSPLAVSNVASERGAFERAITADPESARAAAGVLFDPSSVKRSGVAGTQMMPSIANPAASGSAPSAAAPSGSPAPSAPQRQDRTQLLAAFPAGARAQPVIASTPASGAPSVGGAPSGAPFLAAVPSGPAASTPAASAPAAPSQPPSSPIMSPAPYAPPPQPVAQPLPQAPSSPIMSPAPYAPPPPPQPPPVAQPLPQAPWIPPAPQAPPHQPPQPPMHYGAVAPYAHPGAMQPPAPMMPPMMPPMQPPPAHAGYGFGFGYAPGSRVNVTWSNGQRYPGTVHQVSGSQCLVMFPDGQQHWVEMQYVAPA